MNTPSRKKRTQRKYKPAECTDKMTFQECEMTVLRQVVDESETRQGAKIANSPEVIRIIQILEDFLFSKKLICYGGTAINNILPKQAQFYDKNVEIPDYDFFSPNALQDAKELSDKYYLAGYDEVEAKSGMHPGTYKVYVNFLPVADITYLHPSLFSNLMEDSITIAGIKYAPPNYLRMAMYLELSRPNGDVSRWEKVLKRINLLNKYYPLNPNANCNSVEFQRGLDAEENKDKSESIYLLTRDSFVDQGVVFLGGYGTALYSKYMKEDQRHQVEKIPDFDVLSDDPEKCAMIVRDKLVDSGYKRVKLVQHTSLGEVIPSHIEINVNGDVIALIYKPIACHSYNKLVIAGKDVLVATIDTMLSFYLAFLYANNAYFNKERMLCMAAYLFEVEQKNSLEQKGLLKRFSLDCYGNQPTMEDIRAEKAKKYGELKALKDANEFERWFLKYSPAENKRNVRGPRRIEKMNPNTPSTPLKTVELKSRNKSVPIVSKHAVTFRKRRPKYDRGQTRRQNAKRQNAKRQNAKYSGVYARRNFNFIQHR